MEISSEIKNKIVNAANQLVLEGVVSPTNQEVRNRMGGGSLSHISPVMRDWREKRQKEIATVIEIPTELKLMIESSVSQVWQVAVKIAGAEIDSVKEHCLKDIEGVTIERDEAFMEISALELKLNSSNADLVIANQMLQAKTKECEDLKQSNSSINANYLHSQVEIRGYHKENLYLKDQLEEAKANIKELQQELIALAKHQKKFNE